MRWNTASKHRQPPLVESVRLPGTGVASRFSAGSIPRTILMARVLFICLLLVLPSVLVAQGRELPDFTELAERQGPTVVNISTTQVRERRASPQIPNRSEERRVGKECRARWSKDQ